MLHAKFKYYMTLCSEEDDFKGFAIYEHGSHLGHVTKTIFTKFVVPIPKEAPHIISLCLDMRFQRKICLKIMVI